MMDDAPQTPTQRRRSNSLAHSVLNVNNRASAQVSDGQIKSVPEEFEGSHASGSDVEMDELLAEEAWEEEDDDETGLTQTGRKKRRWQKWHNTQLDQRIADGEDLRKIESSLVTGTMLRTYLINAGLIGSWYTFSIAISVYNKWMFSEENLHFPFPLFTTCAHMVVQFLLATAVLYLFPHFRPKSKVLNPHMEGYSHVEAEEDHGSQIQAKEQQQTMTRWFYLTRIGPCGTATALDIGLGNFSLRFIKLAFFTMCKSSVLAFVLLFAFLFRLEQPSWRLGAIIAVMTIGVVLMVAGETAFNTAGFILVMSASFCSGFRWSLTQILLLRNAATSNPFSSIFFLTPVMFVALLVLALPIEGPIALIKGFNVLAESKGFLLSIVIMLSPGILAFMMVAAEFALLKRTSVVTLSVCGIFKEVLTISTAAKTFGDELSPINISGLVVTIFAIAAYNYLKYASMRKEIHKQAQDLAANRIPEPYDEVDEAEESVSTRRSSAELFRHSLSLATNLPDDARQARAGAVLGNGHAQSPTKRPEDLE